MAYRDYPEAYTTTKDIPKQFEILPWTTDPEKVKEFMSGLEAVGGGDWPEDVSGALLEVRRHTATARPCYEALIFL